MDRLTPREREIVSLIGQGASCARIAALVGISHHTVRTHRRNILGKLALHSSAQLIAFAQRDGAGEPSSIAMLELVRALSARERQVVHCIGQGRTSKQVARDLGISPATVRKHRERLSRRLGMHRAADLIRLAKSLES